MTDKDDVAPCFHQPLCLPMDLGNQRTCGVEPGQAARFRFRRHSLGNAVCRKHYWRAIRHIVQGFDENGPLGPQFINNKAVVDDFVPHIDRRSIFLECAVNNQDGAVDTGTKAPRRGDQEVEGWLFRHNMLQSLRDCLQPGKPLPIPRGNRTCSRMMPVSFRNPIFVVAASGLLLAGCARQGEFDSSGGIIIKRDACPAVAVPSHTADITLFDPPASLDSRAIDVVADITNVRSSCADSGEDVVVSASFDVQARRSNASGARDVVLPYFATVVQGGRVIVSKRVSRVSIHFNDGDLRAETKGSASAYVNRAAVTLPADVQERITRKRKAGDADAAIDPMADPQVREAVSRASFELLLGFQLTQGQLQYNATR